MPSQKILKYNKISILNNKIFIFCDSIMPSQKVKPVKKLIKILKFSIFCDSVMPSQKRKKTSYDINMKNIKISP